MKRTIVLLMIGVVLLNAGVLLAAGDGEGWISLFDGRTLAGWKASENKDTFSVEDGVIVVAGPRSHLFYTGPVDNAIFTDFEFKAEVKTEPGSNSGIYFHTEYQETDWPAKGYEVQVNNTHSDRKKTGGLYAVKDVLDNSPAKDGEWFTEHIIVRGKRIIIKVNGQTTVDWTEPAGYVHPQFPRRKISSGTFALQGHDPKSVVCFRNIMVRPLPVIDFPLVDYHVHLKGGLTLTEAIEISKANGVKFGIAQNCGLGFPVTNDAGARRFINQLKGKGVFIGMQAEGREWVGMFSKEAIAEFDYVFTDAMTFTDDSGKRVRLWIKDEVKIDDKQAFMDMYVGKIVSILNTEPIDIYVNPTFLPEVIAAEYDALWTRERMAKVIDAAVKNDVAIEINARFRIPSEAFVRQAKKADAKFSLGTNNGGRDMGNLEYSRLMIRRCRLKKQDFFTPMPPGKKPVERRGLPRRAN